MKSPLPYLELTLDAARRVQSYAPATEAEFQRSPLIQDAISMRLQEMGENLSKVRRHFPSFYDVHSSDAWNRLIGLRNVISHGYGSLDMTVVWQIVSVHLETVLREVEQALPPS